MIFALVGGSVVAQEVASVDNSDMQKTKSSSNTNNSSAPEVKKEEQIVFVGEDGKIFVNKNLPVYMKFSTTPDGETYDLKSRKNPKDTEPLYLDTEGANYIRTKWAIDPETKEYVQPQREVEMELYADSKPPIINPALAVTSKYKKGNVVYYGRDLSITFKEYDAQSGVKQSYWSLNGSAWNTGESKFEERESGDYTFAYYSVDNVNNYTDPDDISFIYDKTAPATTLLKTPEGTYVFGPKTKVQFDVEENHSGVKATYFRMDGVEFIEAKEDQIMPSELKDGEYNLAYYSIDNVGNGEDSKSESVYLDKIAPETTLSATPSYEDGSLLYIAPGSELTLQATDNKAGVRDIYFTTRGYSNEVYTEPFSLENYHGSSLISYRADDIVDNKEALNQQKLFVDSIRPATTLEFMGDYFEVANRYYVNESTKLKLDASDANSGVDYTEYGNIGSSFDKYDAPFALTKEGYNGMMYRSVDRVENVEYSKSIDLYLDKKGPEIVFNFSNQPMGEEDGVKIYPLGTRLFLGATDDQSGTNTISYKINNQKEVNYSSPKTIDISEKKAFRKGKTYEVAIRTTDLVNNSSEESISFKIEE